MSMPMAVDNKFNSSTDKVPIFKKYINDDSVNKDFIINDKTSYFVKPNHAGQISNEGVINFQDNFTLDAKNEEDINALKTRNTELRNELKNLNSQLTAIVAKQTKTKKLESSIRRVITPGNENTPEMRLHMEIESSKKVLSICQKELKHLKIKYEENNDPSKYTDIEQKIFEMTKMIEKECATKKVLQKMVRDKEKAIEQLQNNNPVTQKGNVLLDDLQAFKEKHKQVSANEERIKTQTKSREEYLAKLQKELSEIKVSYKNAAEKTGYVEKIEKAREKPRSVSRPRKSVSINSIPLLKSGDDEMLTLQYDEENFKKLYNYVKILRKADAAKEKTRNRELQEIQQYILLIEKENEGSKEALTEREKELEVLDSVYKELASLASQNKLQPPSQEKKAMKKEDSSTNLRLPKINSKENKEEKEVQKTEIGEFNDREFVGNHTVKICTIRVWYDTKRLCGIQAIYKTKGGRKLEGKKHIKDPHKYKVAKFEMEDDDYLKDISGHMNPEGNAVECLIFKSFYGKARKVGQPSETGKLFRFDVNDFEFPAIIYGSIREDEEGCVLERLGILLASDELQSMPTNMSAGENFFDKTAVPMKTLPNYAAKDGNK